jgi:hypothetical protein
MKSPHSQVRERFGDKAKLVAAVEALAKKDLWIDRLSDAKQLRNVSNKKLLRLHDVLTRAEQEFGTRAKLIESILAASKRSADAGLKARLERYPLPRLLDTQRAVTRAVKAAPERVERPARTAAKPKIEAS